MTIVKHIGSKAKIKNSIEYTSSMEPDLRLLYVILSADDKHKKVLILNSPLKYTYFSFPSNRT